MRTGGATWAEVVSTGLFHDTSAQRSVSLDVYLNQKIRFTTHLYSTTTFPQRVTGQLLKAELPRTVRQTGRASPFYLF
jgi:hypothetical protein